MARILVIDDDPDMGRFMDRALGAQHQVVLADDADQGIELMSGEAIDLAIVDMFMPGKDGFWVIEQIRAAKPGTKIIAISGGHPNIAPGDALAAAHDMGVDMVMTKPVRVADLRKSVDELLER